MSTGTVVRDGLLRVGEEVDTVDGGGEEGVDSDSIVSDG